MWENDTVLKLPMLFDMLTVVLLVGGCLLLWLNLRPRNDDVLPTAEDRVDSEAQEKVDPVAGRSPREFAAKDASERRADYGAGLLDAAPVQESDAPAEAGSMVQNHYASSVSAAISKSRKASARV